MPAKPAPPVRVPNRFRPDAVAAFSILAAGISEVENGVTALVLSLIGLEVARQVGLRGALAESLKKEWHEGGTPDDRLKSSYSENEKGELEVYLASNVLPVGTRCMLRAGAWSREVALWSVRPNEPNQVGAEVVISRHERATIPPGAALTIDSLSTPANDAITDQPQPQGR